MAPSLDGILEATVLGSFSTIGYRVRERSWTSSLPSMSGSTAVVTGGTSGIGLAAARRMVELGADVIVVGRSRGRLDAAVRELGASGGARVVGHRADLSSMAEVRVLAERLLDEEAHIDVLVNNASVLLHEREETREGIESTLATNLLAPFLLTNLLIPRLVASAPSRIVTVSSGGMYTEPLDVWGLDMDESEYNGTTAYARTKRAQVVLTQLWAERLEGTGVVAHSMHPGWVDTSGVAAALPKFHRLLGPLLRSPDEGADTIVWLASSGRALTSSGGFWMDRAPRAMHRIRRTGKGDRHRDELWPYLCEATSWSELSGWPLPTIDS